METRQWLSLPLDITARALDPSVYSALRKIFPFSTLLPNTFSVQPEIIRVFTYCVFYVTVIFVWLVVYRGLLVNGHCSDVWVPSNGSV